MEYRRMTALTASTTTFIMRLFLCLLVWAADSDESYSLEDTLETLFRTESYDRRVRPLADKGYPTNVTVHLNINNINNIDEINMDFSVNMYLRVSWEDARLRHNLTSSILLNQISGHLTWLPDIFFSNEQPNTGCSSYQDNQYERISSDGTVLMSKSVSATYSCVMDIRLYPVDNQTCYIQIESYGHNTDEIKLVWDRETPIIIPPNLHVTEFGITDKSATRCDAVLDVGTFPCLKASFHLQRMSGVYLMNAYLPAVLVVIMSWIAFWLHVTAIAARISIGLLTVLTMTTQTTSIISDLPRVPYIKAIEIWMCGCLVFVFIAFLETALAFVVENAGPKRGVEERNITFTTISKAVLTRNQSDFNIPPMNNANDIGSQRTTSATSKSERRGNTSNGTRERQAIKGSLLETLNKCTYPRAKTVDRISRISFPFAFAIFNIIYWIICYTE